MVTLHGQPSGAMLESPLLCTTTTSLASYLLDQTAQLGAGHPLLLLVLPATATATAAVTTATATATVTITATTKATAEATTPTFLSHVVLRTNDEN